jgi:hypothetical protein
MIARALAVAAIALGLTASTTDPLAGRTAGKPQQCIELSRMNGPAVYGTDTIIYRQSGRRSWATHPVGSCPSLRAFSRLIVHPTGTQLCHNDRFETFEPGDIIASASCRFGDFTPYDTAPR